MPHLSCYTNTDFCHVFPSLECNQENTCNNISLSCMAQTPSPPSFSQNSSIGPTLPGTLGTSCFYGWWHDYLELVIWLGSRLHASTREGVDFFLPWFTHPSASSVHFQYRKDSVRSDIL